MWQKWNDFVGRKTALLTETLFGPCRRRTVGPLAMATAIHFQLHFLKMEYSIQSSLEISESNVSHFIQEPLIGRSL